MPNNRRRGNQYEVDLMNRFKEWGFEDCVTSRSESKNRDDQGVDLMKIPFNVQAKNEARRVPYERLLERMPDDADFNCVIHRFTEKKGERFYKKGEYVIMEFKSFEKLISNYYKL